MSNTYYTPTGTPAPRTVNSSAQMRAEFAQIGQAFDEVEQAISGTLLRNGSTALTGTLTSTVAEALKITHAAGTVAGYTANGATRNGFLSFNDGVGVKLHASVGKVEFGTAGVARGFVDEAGRWLFGRADSTLNSTLEVAGAIGSSRQADRVTGLVGDQIGDNFVVSGQRVGHYNLTWKQLPELVQVGPSAVLSGYGGISLFTLGTERVRVGHTGELAVGVSAGAAGALRVRNDVSTQFGALLSLSCRAQNAGVHPIGAVLFDAFRDVADPSYVAGMWAEGEAPFSNYGDLAFGAMRNGSANLPTELLRIAGRDGAVYPGTDNVQVFGTPARRWSTGYAASGWITTSDARQKAGLFEFDQRERDAAADLSKNIGRFQYLSAIAEKGGAARYHIGLTVQQAMHVLQRNGLEPTRYAFICHDSWPEKHIEHPAQFGPDGETIEAAYTEVVPAGDTYGFRYDELAMFLLQGLETRIAALEASA